MNIDDLADVILADVLADFLNKHLGSGSLKSEYVGVSIPILKTKLYGEGSSAVDFDLAFKQLEENGLVKTGPMAPYENPPGSQLVIMTLFSKREFVYLTEKGYRAAQKLSKSSPTERMGSSNSQRSAQHDDREFALLAIQEARKSVSENDGRPHPKVGAIIVKDGKVLSIAHRGEQPENHAEYIALEKKLGDATLVGATVYTTLEPCTTRNHTKVPCADRLIERKVARVVIGMLDPDPRITGRGQRKLRTANIITDLFPADLMTEVEELNRKFTRFHEQENQRGEALNRKSVQEVLDAVLPARNKMPGQESYLVLVEELEHVGIRDTADLERFIRNNLKAALARDSMQAWDILKCAERDQQPVPARARDGVFLGHAGLVRSMLKDHFPESLQELWGKYIPKK